MPPSAEGPPAEPSKVASEYNICDPASVITPPSLSTVEGKPSTTLNGSLRSRIGRPNRCGLKSNSAEDPRTSMAAPSSATILPEIEIDPPGKSLPERNGFSLRRTGLGAYKPALVPATERRADEPTTTVAYAVWADLSSAVGRRKEERPSSLIDPPRAMMEPLRRIKSPCRETVGFPSVEGPSVAIKAPGSISTMPSALTSLSAGTFSDVSLKPSALRLKRTVCLSPENSESGKNGVKRSAPSWREPKTGRAVRCWSTRVSALGVIRPPTSKLAACRVPSLDAPTTSWTERDPNCETEFKL